MSLEHLTEPIPSKEFHYLPANNMFASRMCGGIEQMRKDLHNKIQESQWALEKIRAEGIEPHESWLRWLDWYKTSCEYLIEQAEQDEELFSDYPQFEVVP